MAMQYINFSISHEDPSALDRVLPCLVGDDGFLAPRALLSLKAEIDDISDNEEKYSIDVEKAEGNDKNYLFPRGEIYAGPIRVADDEILFFGRSSLDAAIEFGASAARRGFKCTVYSPDADITMEFTPNNNTIDCEDMCQSKVKLFTPKMSNNLISVAA